LFKWNKLPGTDVNNLFQTGVYFKVENDFYNTTLQNISLNKIENFAE
jgi:hypothetical protein